MPAAGTDDSDPNDLPVGDRLADDSKADNWGAALTCKPVPSLPQLRHPKIVVSLDGRTVHVTDPETGYDKVFPAGVGAVETDEAEASFGESKSYYPIIATGQNDFSIKLANVSPCKTWWSDPETGEKSPVFAGLPFMPFFGGYALHGPIDNFRASNGGNLRRGYVSHGCIRMEAADVMEIYARIKSLVSVPVHLQREPERLADGTRVDLLQKWIGSECQVDADCNYAGGVCHGNHVGGRGFCSQVCGSSCPDRAGQPTTFCVADPDRAGQGMCVAKVTAPYNVDCRPSDHMLPKVAPRNKQTVTATVCLPASRGWIGDRCDASNPCSTGNSCSPAGVCTQACVTSCPDLDGAPWTYCAKDAAIAGSGNTCVRQCTPASNGSECPADEACVARPRARDGKTMYACTPRG